MPPSLMRLIICAMFIAAELLSAEAAVAEIGRDWKQLVTDGEQMEARFLPRAEAAYAVFLDKMCVLGGITEGELTNTVQVSSNGVQWELMPTPPWSARSRHVAVVHGDALFVFGGGYDSEPHFDVWKTRDLKDWQYVSEISEAYDSEGFNSAVSYRGAIFAFSSAGRTWSSLDGSEWETLPTATSDRFKPAQQSSATVYGDRIWLSGYKATPVCTYYEDYPPACFYPGLVASTTDGINWEYVDTHTVNYNAPYVPLEVVGGGGALWAIGGVYTNATNHTASYPDYYTEIYRKVLGEDWLRMPESIPWQGRSGGCLLSYHGNLYFLGGSRIEQGYSLHVLGDVWVSEKNHTEHSEDLNGDGNINLSELLRGIQFYNSLAYSCEPPSEDGFAPGIGDHDCIPASIDYSPQDWTVSLEELLRLIQFYNGGGYHPCDSGEDGFCLGASPALPN